MEGATSRAEHVRQGCEAFNRRDFEAAVAGFHPEIVWDVLDVVPDPDTYHGLDGVRRFWDMWIEAIGDFRLDVQEASEHGDHVIALVRIRGRGRDSSAELVTPSFAQLWTFEGEAIVRVAMYTSRNAALEAIGAETDKGG